MDIKQKLEAAVDSVDKDSKKLHDIVNGDDNDVISTDGGPVDSIAKVIKGATTSAQTAAAKAADATRDAATAATKAADATTSAQTAATKAGDATTSAQTAATKAGDATRDAKTIADKLRNITTPPAGKADLAGATFIGDVKVEKTLGTAVKDYTGNRNDTVILIPNVKNTQVNYGSRYLKVVLPNSWLRTSIKFKVSVMGLVYDGSKGFSTTFEIGGRLVPNIVYVRGIRYDRGYWDDVYATVISGELGNSYYVTFGHEGGKCVVYIRKETGDWHHLIHPWLLDFMAFGGTDSHYDKWTGEWELDYSSSASSTGREKTVPAQLEATNALKLGNVVAGDYALKTDIPSSVDTSGLAKLNGTNDFTDKVKVTKDKDSPLELNRTGNAGALIEFKLNNAKTGSISDYGYGLGFIVNKSGFRLEDSTGAGVGTPIKSLTPCDDSGNPNDGVIDLGRSNIRWKNLWLSGNASVKGAIGSEVDAVPARHGDLATILTPKGGLYAHTGPKTGHLKITLPKSWSDTRIKFQLSIQQNVPTGSGSVTLELGGDNTTAAHGWEKTFAHVLAGQLNQYYNVIFKHDGTHCAIYIGEVSDTWTDLRVSITNLTTSGSSSSFNDWATGWDIGIETSIITSTRVVTSSSYASRAALAINAEQLGGKDPSEFAERKDINKHLYTYYVASSGNDSTGDGSSSKPFKTIKKAIDSAPEHSSCVLRLKKRETFLVDNHIYVKNKNVRLEVDSTLPFDRVHVKHKVSTVGSFNRSATIYIYYNSTFSSDKVDYEFDLTHADTSKYFTSLHMFTLIDGNSARMVVESSVINLSSRDSNFIYVFDGICGVYLRACSFSGASQNIIHGTSKDVMLLCVNACSKTSGLVWHNPIIKTLTNV